MSDFPKGGDVNATRAWLDKKGFLNVLVGWEADALLGLDKADVLALIPGEGGLKLSGYLNTARNTTSNVFSYCCLLKLLNVSCQFDSPGQSVFGGLFNGLFGGISLTLFGVQIISTIAPPVTIDHPARLLLPR